MARAVLQKVESPARPELLEQARVSYERAQDEYQRMKLLYESKSLPPNDDRKQFSFLPKPFTLKQLVGAVKEAMQD